MVSYQDMIIANNMSKLRCIEWLRIYRCYTEHWNQSNSNLKKKSNQILVIRCMWLLRYHLQFAITNIRTIVLTLVVSTISFWNAIKTSNAKSAEKQKPDHKSKITSCQRRYSKPKHKSASCKTNGWYNNTEKYCTKERSMITCVKNRE